MTNNEESSVPQINVNHNEITPIPCNVEGPTEVPKIKVVIPKPAEENTDIMVAKTDESKPSPKWWKNMNVEIFMFLFMFGSTLELTTNGNLFMDRVCLVNMNISEEICANLTGNQGILNKVQAQSNNTTLYTILITMLPGAIYALFAGTWSDKYGRKPLLYSAILGTIVHDVMFLLYVYFDHLPVEYCLVTFVPVSLTGGLIVVIGMIYSMTSDRSGVAKRTIKYAILEAAIFLALPLAGLAAGQLYKYYGFLPVYGGALFFHLSTLLFLTFVLKESSRGPSGISFSSKLVDFFTLDAVKDNFRSCFKKRENYGRAQILLLLLVGCFLLLNYLTLSSMSYFYANKMYGWDLPHYTTVSTIFSIATMVVMIFAVPVTTIFMKMDDATLGLIGSVSMAAQNATKAFSYEPWIFYLSYVFGLMSGMAILTFRSKLSKTVQADELGKIFAVLAVFESLVPTPGNLLFTQIYNHTLDTFPGLIFLVGSIMLILPIGVFVWLMRLPGKTNYESVGGEILPSEANLDPTTVDATSIEAKA